MTPEQTVVETIEVVVNGRVRAIPAGCTVQSLLIELGLEPDVVVVERNGEILSRDRFDAVCLDAGDTLEIVHIVGGG